MNSAINTSGSILKIERMSIHDGQGFRTVLFFKGCPLKCSWCSTPESQSLESQKGYDAELCSVCGECIRACEVGAISISADGMMVQTDRDKCTLCYDCLAVCPSNALKRFGTLITVEEAVKTLNRDEVFYFHSGGGVTLSGGEPLCQAPFAAEILKQCKRSGIHTAMESCMHARQVDLETVLPWLDVIYADIKHMDSSIHRQWVGEDNALILGNIKKADQFSYPLEIVARIPLIPNFNDNKTNLCATLDFCRGLQKLKEIELLPYHRLGLKAYRCLGIDYTLPDLLPQTSSQLLEWADFLRLQNSGIPIKIGSGFI